MIKGLGCQAEDFILNFIGSEGVLGGEVTW